MGRSTGRQPAQGATWQRQRRLAWVLFFAAAQVEAAASWAVALRPVVSLEPGHPVKREMRGGDPHHFYRLELAAGQYVRVHVDQHGIDVALTLRDAEAREIAHADIPDDTERTERISLVVERSGAYTLEIGCVQSDAVPGSYRAEIAVIRPAIPRDRRYVEAERATDEGSRLKQQGKAETLAQAMDRYQHALKIWREIGERERQGDVLDWMAEILQDTAEAPKAIPLLEEALSLQRASSDRRGEGFTLHTLGNIYDELGEKTKALEFLNQTAELYRALGDRHYEVEALAGAGGVYDDLGEPEKALQYYTLGLETARSLKDRNLEYVTLNNSAHIYSLLGETHKALDYYVQTLALARQMKSRRFEGIALSAIGVAYFSLGETDRAISYLEQALPVRHESGDRRGEAYVFSWLGVIHSGRGDYRQALADHEGALPLLRAAGDRSSEATTLSRIGTVYDLMGEKEKALEAFTQSIALKRAVSDPLGEGRSLHALGASLGSSGRWEEALENLEKALVLERRTQDLPWQANTLAVMARIERDRGSLVQARSRIEKALELVESLRIRVSDPELRASYLASVQGSYDFHVDLLMRLHRVEPSHGYDVAAFEASQRIRARSLLELLQESSIPVRQGIDSKLLERERALQRLLSAKLERQIRLAKGNPDDVALRALAREIEQITTEYDALKSEIRTTSPRYAALTQPRPLALVEIQRELEPDTLLLSYNLGEEKSFLWAVTSSSLITCDLPARKEIESAARRLYDLLTARNRRIGSESIAQRLARVVRSDREYTAEAILFSRLLLGPVAGQLSGKRLLIVSDGALQYLPFAALPSPANEPRPLVAEHEIVNLPSASILPILRREHQARRPPPKTLAVLADPVFTSDDERVRAGSVSQRRREAPPGASSPPEPLGDRDVVRSAVDTGLADRRRLRIPRLPYTRREANAISSLVPPDMRREALDFQANLTTATDPDLSQYRFVHFATHGFLNSLRPELSGLVLSLVDRRGKERPGFLHATEIFNLRLLAELVVLSGCRTGLGKEIRGEGLLGMTQGFLYAGAEKVVVSLWDVNDLATAKLMSLFYVRMLGKSGDHPSAALREAQLEIARTNRWHAPYYWAGFVLQGGAE